MVVTASEIFDFLDQHRTFAIEKYEISSAEFSILRRSLRSIVLSLDEGDGDDARDTSDRLRMLLSEWLTVPVRFDRAILDAVQTLGESDSIESKWGRDVRAWYDAARTAAQDLSLRENPVREKLRDVIRELRIQGRAFRIYCHRRAATQFESVLAPTVDAALGEAAFLHSVKEYRDSKPFDVLIKFGPLRSRGWGAAPDAIVAAPRFTTLTQVVWSGCGDEENFGYDPVATPGGITAVGGHGAVVGGISWTTRVMRSGSDVTGTGDFSDVDEFRLFRQLNQALERRRATLIQIDGEHGILYPPHSQVLSFDPDPDVQEPLGHRLPGETLVEGMFVVRQRLLDVDLGGLNAGLGHYSRIWKARLAGECEKDAAALAQRLRLAGVNLVHLRAALVHWCKAPTTVIHAPQQSKHFEILIQVLGVDFDAAAAPPSHRRAWWRYAWGEVSRSRGDAIQAGVQGSEIIEEEFCFILNGILPDIRLRAAAGDEFAMSIPAGQGLQGDALFNKVRSVEEGFLAPDTELKLVCDLNSIEQWRV